MEFDLNTTSDVTTLYSGIYISHEKNNIQLVSDILDDGDLYDFDVHMGKVFIGPNGVASGKISKKPKSNKIPFPPNGSDIITISIKGNFNNSLIQSIYKNTSLLERIWYGSSELNPKIIKRRIKKMNKHNPILKRIKMLTGYDLYYYTFRGIFSEFKFVKIS